MYKAVYLKEGKLNVDTQAYLSKHKIIFKTPQYKGYNGMPIGNGRFGGMMYSSHTKTHFAVNHTDAINFCKDGNFDAWSWESEEDNTAHVSCGHLTITDNMPSFDVLYLEDFDASLDIANGVASLNAKTPFSENSVTSFVNDEFNMQLIEIKSASSDAVERNITLSRWGSRNFFHDYEQVSADKTKNLLETYSGEYEDVIYVTQNVRGCSTAVLISLEGNTPHQIHKLNGHSIEYVLENSNNISENVFIRTIVEDSQIDINKAIKKFKSDISKLTVKKLLENQNEAWKRFWDKSMIHLPDSDYLENLYYTYAYSMNSCSRGKYPVTFGSIWCHNHDTRNWGHFYHWNHQQTYWGFQVTGHDELCKNYYEYRTNMLPNAIKDGEALFGIKGAFISDITNYNGYQALEPDTVRNLTCASQIALDFYRQYQYSQDKKFLEEKAYPFIYWSLALYEGILFKNNEGVYEVKGGSSCYESYWNLKRTITDRNMLIALVNAGIDASIILNRDEDKRELWKELCDNIYEMPVTQDYKSQEKTPVISAGVKWDNKVVEYLESDYPMNTFGLCQLCGVFPAGTVGLSKQDDEFMSAQNTFNAFMRDLVYGDNCEISGHSTAPLLAARLGQREDTLKLLNLYAEKYQVFNNGLMHFANIKTKQFYGDTFKARVIEQGAATDWENVHEKTHGERIMLDATNFPHCYFEAHGELFAGVNEMLLQSYDGTIRLFPATPKSYNATFSLRAVGGFEVISEMHDGIVRYAYINSFYGNDCAIIMPWKNEQIRILCDGYECEHEIHNDILKFKTLKGRGYLIERCAFPLPNYYINEIPYEENTSPKYYVESSIGCEKQF